MFLVFFYVSIFFYMSEVFAQVTCDTGKICFLENKSFEYKRALKDGPIVYIEDLESNLRSYSVDVKNKLTRTNIYRLPVVGKIYNWFHKNTYKLLEPSKDHLAKWAISRTMYDNDPNCITISLFEVIQNNPILIRNRDPWLYPSDSFTHKGPFDMCAVHITALDRWVAISGYNKEGKKVFAYKELNYDLVGYNFFMNYSLEHNVEWKSNKLFSYASKKIGVSQSNVNLPLDDWKIVNLPNNAAPNILLKRIDKDIHLFIPLQDNENYALSFDITELSEFSTLHSITTEILYTHIPAAKWPKINLPLVTNYKKENVQLNGVKGFYTESSQDPFDGTFTDYTTHKSTKIYKTIRGLLNFFMNTYTYMDEFGNVVNFKNT